MAPTKVFSTHVKTTSATGFTKLSRRSALESNRFISAWSLSSVNYHFWWNSLKRSAKQHVLQGSRDSTHRPRSSTDNVLHIPILHIMMECFHVRARERTHTAYSAWSINPFIIDISDPPPVLSSILSVALRCLSHTNIICARMAWKCLRLLVTVTRGSIMEYSWHLSFWVPYRPLRPKLLLPC